MDIVEDFTRLKEGDLVQIWRRGGLLGNGEPLMQFGMVREIQGNGRMSVDIGNSCIHGVNNDEWVVWSLFTLDGLFRAVNEYIEEIEASIRNKRGR